MASGGIHTRGRDGGDGPAVLCCTLCSPLADTGDVAVAVRRRRHGFGRGALSLLSLLSSPLSLSLSSPLSLSLSSTLLVMWQLPSVGSWSANGRWGDGGVLTWVIGAFPMSSLPLLSSHHPALAVFALPVVPGVTHILRKGEGRGSWVCLLSFSLRLSLCSSVSCVTWHVTWGLHAVGYDRIMFHK